MTHSLNPGKQWYSMANDKICTRLAGVAPCKLTGKFTFVISSVINRQDEHFAQNRQIPINGCDS